MIRHAGARARGMHRACGSELRDVARASSPRPRVESDPGVRVPQFLLEARSFARDAAVALEYESQASTSKGALAESLPKAGSELADAGAVPSPQSPPPGAGPERDPAVSGIRSRPDAMGHYDFRCVVKPVVDYLSNEDPGDQA